MADAVNLIAMRGAPARAIHDLAGHADLATTQVYMHLSQAAVDSAIRLLEKPVRGLGEVLQKGAGRTKEPNDFNYLRAPEVGLEPTANRLTADRSTT